MNTISERLETGDPAVGAWLLSGSPRVGEVLSRTALDWIGIDTEHAPYSPECIEELVRAVEREASPLVRLPSIEAAISGTAKQVLDSGARGVIVPDIDTPEEAERVVRAARFPPKGERGVAGTIRANAYGTKFDDYVATANDETLVVIQIESRAAVAGAEDILAVDGIDVVLIGENDLSTTYGHPGKIDHPEVQAALEHVLEAAQTNDVYPGIAGRTPTRMAERVDRGFRFFLLGADLSFMRDGIQQFLAE